MHFAHAGGSIKFFRYFFSPESQTRKYARFNRQASDKLADLVRTVKTPSEMHRRLTKLHPGETKSSGWQVRNEKV